MKFNHYSKFVAYLIIAVGVSSASAGAYEDFVKAVEVHDVATVQRLLQRGMDPNTRDEKGQPALTLALRDGAFPLAEALLASPQVDVDATNAAGETPLMMAALKGQTEWMTRLLARGAKVQRPGWSPVLYAASAPEPQALALLLDKGAPVDARSPNGSTPLMMAAKYGSERSVDLLLSRGADPAALNDRQLTAADFARQAGREALAERLAKLRR
jgi:ankyrin repeat protein